MKRQQPDIGKIAVDRFIAAAGFNRKLKRLWGTEVVNGITVMNNRRFYYNFEKRPENYERLFKFLKVYDDVITNFESEGIKNAWFTLNKTKGYKDLEGDLVDNSYVSGNLNAMWWDDLDGPIPENLTLTTKIVIGDRIDGGSGFLDISLDSSSKEELAEHVIQNYDDIWENNVITQEGVGVINKGSLLDPINKIEVPDEDDLSPDDPWLSTIARYALRSSDVPCTVKDVEIGIELGGNNRIRNTLVVTLEIPYKTFDNSDEIVQRIIDDINTENFPVYFEPSFRAGISSGIFFVGNENRTQDILKRPTYVLDSDEIDSTLVTRNYTSWEDSKISVEDNEHLWVEYEGVYYLRSDVIDNPKNYGLTHVTLNSYLVSVLDTGYQKRKASVWQKVVAIIVFVVAVVVTYISWGSSSSVTGPLAAAALAVLSGSFIISLITLALSALGMNTWALAFAWASQTVEPLVTIASIYMIYYGAAQNGIIEAAKDYAANELNNMLFDLVLQEFGELGKLISDVISGGYDSISLASANRLVNAYNNIQVAKLEDINKRNADLKAEYDDIVADGEKEDNIPLSYMNIYTRPATSDWSVYASQFDLPYERGGGLMAIGNIQKTTKKALRPASYEESIFEDLKLV